DDENRSHGACRGPKRRMGGTPPIRCLHRPGGTRGFLGLFMGPAVPFLKSRRHPSPPTPAAPISIPAPEQSTREREEQEDEEDRSQQSEEPEAEGAVKWVPIRGRRIGVHRVRDGARATWTGPRAWGRRPAVLSQPLGDP